MAFWSDQAATLHLQIPEFLNNFIQKRQTFLFAKHKLIALGHFFEARFSSLFALFQIFL